MTGAQRRQRLERARLYLCTDARTGQGDLAEFVTAALIGGVDIIQLRDKSIEASEEKAALELVRDLCHAHGALVSVNDRADLAMLIGADVFHTGQGDLSVADCRALLGPDVILGRSTNSFERALEAASDDEVDYFCVGPVWPTPTKPGRAAVGVELIERVAEAEPGKPWFAIGGVDSSTAVSVLEAGAERIVVVRAITTANDPAAAARELIAVLDDAERLNRDGSEGW
ncbi:thiamine phosphate synthase [Lysinibacter cavernae]|uniref:thiamine phosphate synthase n=1 Tax=Lysinibacter cavernae TaxID=1640652 RepID=UPI001ABB45D9|nr:thiamine phosphate synthase [Lysinibacter cavernae]